MAARTGTASRARPRAEAAQPEGRGGLYYLDRLLRYVLLTLMAWGDRHLRGDEDRPMVVEHSCGNELLPVVSCSVP